MILYNKEDLAVILKKTKSSFVLFIVFVSLTVISLLSFVLFSFYEMKTLFQIIGSIVTSLFAGLSIYFIDRNLFFRRIATEYLNILNEEGVKSIIEITDINSRITTLSDKSTVYEISCLDNEKMKTLYLSSLFDLGIEKGKTYQVVTVLNYVKEYYEKD